MILFCNRKFADIGKTVSMQFSGGNLEISKWCDIVNVHALPGPGVIDGIRKIRVRKYYIHSIQYTVYCIYTSSIKNNINLKDKLNLLINFAA